ncbi:MAG: hypothetical protein GY798_15780 [Hyphomicrobiales bacterium]|nr:hypothetical protein [Hyphomicrobiales bacterium]
MGPSRLAGFTGTRRLPFLPRALRKLVLKTAVGWIVKALGTRTSIGMLLDGVLVGAE